MICFASTTVIIPSSLYLSETPSSTKNVWATGAGSANPVVSINTPSKSRILSYRLSNTSVKSPLTVQQMQPFMTSITLSSELSTKIFSSIPTSPNSFSITANFILCSVLDKIWLSSVVFPEPRNPVNTVTGILRFGIFKAPYLNSRGMGGYLTSTNNFMASNYLSKSMVTINQMLIYWSKPSIRSSFKIVG